MKTARELAALIGKHAEYRTNGLTFSVQIKDARNAWGSVHVEITPAAGSGKRWVSLESVTVI